MDGQTDEHSRKCFNAKNFFFLCKVIFSHKIQDLGRVSTKKGIVSDGGGGSPKGEKKFICISG